MPTAKFKFKVPSPDGPFAVSTEYLDEEFRILAAFPVDAGLLVVFELSWFRRYNVGIELVNNEFAL